MSRSALWFAIAVAWWIDAALALVRHRTLQGALAATFACCFFAIGLVVQRRSQRRRQRRA